MKIALSVWSCHHYFYNKSMTNADFIRFVAATQAKGVELLSVFWNPDELESVKEALRETGVEVACFGACNNLAEADASRRAAQLKDITDSVDMAAFFGAKVVRVFSGDKSEGVEYDQAKAWIIEGLKEAAAYALSKGVTLCLENHGYFAGKAEQVIEVISTVNSPALRSTFDTGNFLLVDEQPSEAVVKLKPYISHVHVKDFLRVEAGLAGPVLKSIRGDLYMGKIPGDGGVDLEYILSEIKSSGYDEWLTVEFEGAGEQKDGSVRSIDRVRNILSSLI